MMTDRGGVACTATRFLSIKNHVAELAPALRKRQTTHDVSGANRGIRVRSNQKRATIHCVPCIRTGIAPAALRGCNISSNLCGVIAFQQPATIFGSGW